MKIAVTGKGGVGKTTFAATLARLYAAEGRPVLAADVDPDANLAWRWDLTRKRWIPSYQSPKCVSLWRNVQVRQQEISSII